MTTANKISGLMIVFSMATAAAVPTAKPDAGPAAGDFLELEAPISRWVDAIPLGNGQAGALIWGEGDELRITLDRADYWHLHRNRMLDDPRFKWRNLPAYTNDYEKLKAVFVVREDPTKLPGVRLVAKLAGGWRLVRFSLDIRDGSSRIMVATPSGTRVLRAWFDDTSPYLSLAVPADVSFSSLQFTTNAAFAKLTGYPAPEIEISSKGAFYRRGNRAGETSRWAKPFIAGVAFIRPGGKVPNSEPVANGYWSRFWRDSDVRVPDAELQHFYDFAMYCYGAASRTPHAPIALQAVWTADNGDLPPWHGDYHMDLNIQETYWAAPVAGKFDALDAYADHMVAVLPALQAYGRDFFDMKDGAAAIPGHMAYDGTFIAGAPMWALPPVHGLWAFQQVFDAWAYRPTTERLEKIWPLAVALADGAEQVLLPPDAHGVRRYAISASPEFGENTPQSVTLKGNTTYDLSVTRGFFKEVARLAAAKGDTARETRWRALAEALGGPHLDEQGRYLLDASTPLTFPHRHPSHLHDIFPYFDVAPQADAKASYAAFRALGLSRWAGHTIVECACKAAAIGDGDEALFCLRAFASRYTARNGFHINGYYQGAPQLARKRDVFTLEANMAMARGVQEMLLRGEWGRISLFPALPREWADKEVSFRGLAVPGGHRVSARKTADGAVSAEILGFSDATVQLVLPNGSRREIALAAGKVASVR